MRELRLRQACRRDTFVRRHEKEIFGPEQLAKETVRLGKSRYGGFVRFCGTTHLKGDGANDLWGESGDNPKFPRRDDARNTMRDLSGELRARRGKFRAYAYTWPMGRIDKGALVRFPDIRRRIEDDCDSLKTESAKANLTAWEKKANFPKKPYVPLKAFWILRGMSEFQGATARYVITIKQILQETRIS